MLFRFFLLGAIQGLTEFLPISSSGHLVILQKILGVAEADIGFDIMVHIASLAALFIFCRRDLIFIMRSLVMPKLDELASYRKIALFILYASIVTAVIGFTFKDFFQRAFSSLTAVAVGLFITGTVVFLTRVKLGSRPKEKINFWDGLFVGLAQGASILPGLSRSGLSISVGLFRGIERNLAVRLSFLLAIPAIIGAAIFKMKDIAHMTLPLPYLSIAFFSSFIFSFLALKILVGLVRKSKLHYFAYYCWALSAVIFYSLAKGILI